MRSRTVLVTVVIAAMVVAVALLAALTAMTTLRKTKTSSRNDRPITAETKIQASFQCQPPTPMPQ